MSATARREFRTPQGLCEQVKLRAPGHGPICVPAVSENIQQGKRPGISRAGHGMRQGIQRQAFPLMKSSGLSPSNQFASKEFIKDSRLVKNASMSFLCHSSRHSASIK